MMKNELLFYTKNDVPFPGARVSIHNPRISEIGLISEEVFNRGLQLLEFSKDSLSTEDKRGLEGRTDFDIFMSIIHLREHRESKNDILQVLSILFPDYEISISPDKEILLSLDGESYKINNTNFEEFKLLLKQIFNFGKKAETSQYKPEQGKAAVIAEKLRKSREKKARMKKTEDTEVSLFRHCISVLSVGLNKDWNILTEYTVNQLLDEFERFQRKEEYDIYVKSKLAGASDIDDVDNWVNDNSKE